MEETRMNLARSRHAWLAFALMAATGAACAQSSLTIFGVMDASLTWGKGSGAGSADRLQVANGSYNSSRLGFRGTEDLGGGLSASFWLEAGVSNDDGRAGGSTSVGNQVSASSNGLNFSRRSTVSLAGPWGEVRVGRDYTPQFWNLTSFSPFGTNGVGTSQAYLGTTALNGVTAVRASNAISYFLPAKLGGVYGQVQYFAGENASTDPNPRDGTGGGIRVGYAAGPLNVAVGTGYTRNAAGGVHQSNIAGHWDLGPAKLMATYERDSRGTAQGRGWVFGGVAPVGAGEVRAAISRYTTDRGAALDPRSTNVALGYVHNLSKRTALYTTLARVSNSGGATAALGDAVTAPNSASTGLDLGVRHTF
ncbi:MAG TPA: porin [Ramlibacter sp.]|nr:porin [Ramlibacter sp.]